MDKSNEWAIGYLVKIYREIQDWPKASKFLEKHQKLTNFKDNHRLALYKIQEGRNFIRKKEFKEARKTFENSINICNDIAAAYYFIGNSYSEESEVAYQNSTQNKIDISSIPTIHGVIFPDTPKEHRVNLGQKIKPEMIIWGEDVIDLEKSLTKMFNLNRGEYQLKEEEKQLIRKTLYGIDLKSPFKKVLKLGELLQDLEFNEDQQSFLLSVFNNKKMIVKGLAGTGKTIIAAKIATHDENKDKKVLILTKTKGLCQFLKVLTRDQSSNNLRIYSIDQFVKKTADRLNVPMTLPTHKATQEELNEHFDNYSPQRCQQIFDMHPAEKFDLLIIDESQDFHKNWFEALCFAKKDDGQIVFFYDPFQEQIEMSMISDLEKAEDVTKFALKLNFRNTWEITNLLQKLIINFYPENKLLYSKPIENHAKKPELIEINNRNEQIEKITETIDKLVKKEKILPKNIAVIYDGSIRAPSRSDPSLTTEIKKKGLGVVSAEEYSEPYLDKSKENCITLDSIRRFKGLEKTVIILTNLDEITRETVKNLYTGLSRARAHLIIITNKYIN